MTGISCLSLQSDADNPSNCPVALQSAYSQRRDLSRDDRTRKSAQVHKILDAVEIRMVPCQEKLSAKPTNTGPVEIESELTCLCPTLEKLKWHMPLIEQHVKLLGEQLDNLEALVLEWRLAVTEKNEEPVPCHCGESLFYEGFFAQLRSGFQLTSRSSL